MSRTNNIAQTETKAVRHLSADEVDTVAGAGKAARKSGEGQKDFLKITLHEVFISS